MKRSGLLYLMIVLLTFLPDKRSYGQGILDNVIGPLEHWASIYPQEKIHIHFDKPYYIAGDTIWLKVYNVVGARHQLSAISGAVYIDLLSEADSLVSAIKLPMMAGLAKGNIDLPDDLPPGNYRIRGYTQWMRNAGHDFYFDERIIVGNISEGQSKARITYHHEPGKKDGKVIAKINFFDSKNQPLTDRTVTYQLKTSSELLQTGRAKTDGAGMVQIDLKAPENPAEVSTNLLSSIQIEKGVEERHYFPVKASFLGTDIQFFPESGHLVADLPARVAFKALGPSGLGVDVTGVVKDMDEQVVAEFESQHAGMGVFTLTPAQGNTYTAEFHLSDGSQLTIPLPAVAEEGYILSTYHQQEADFLLVRVLASKNLFKPISLLVQSQGEVLYAADISLTKSLTNVRVPLDDFPSGIVQLTLFNEKGVPENERVVFINKHDQMAINITSDRDKYSTRDEVALTINAKDPNGELVNGNFSISVVDETRVPVNELAENSIISQLLLSSDIEGHIENPYYYFSNAERSNDHLDLLMMTQGYRRFLWSDVLQGKISEPAYPAEKLTSTISGRLLNLFGKPVKNGKITLFSMAASVTLDTVTNDDGRFEFSNLLLTDSIKFTIQGRTEKNSDKVEILLDGIPGMVITPNNSLGSLSLDIPDSIGSYLKATVERDQALSKLGLRSRVIRLDEVTVTGSRTLRTSGNMNGSGRADQVISANELSACPTLRMCLEGRLHGVIFRSEQTSAGPISLPISTRGGRMMVVIDSRQLHYNNDSDLLDIAGVFDQNMIDISSILSIEVLRSPSLTSIYGQAASNGVIIINTKGWVPGQRSDFSTKLYAPRGYSNMREFYSPKYGISDLIDAQADMRTTIYWNPTVVVNNGSSTVKFVNAGSPGTYRVVVEGITVDGKLGRQVFRYKVE